MIFLIAILIGVNIALIPNLFPIKGESDSLGVLIAYCKHSKRWRWLAGPLWKDDWENEYHDRMWKRMHDPERNVLK